MIYQLANKTTQILPLATSHQFNHVFALLISMLRIKRINFYQNRPEIKLVLQKNTKFCVLQAALPEPPKLLPPLQVSGYGPRTQVHLILCHQTFFQILSFFSKLDLKIFCRFKR